MVHACNANEVTERLLIALVIALGGKQDKVQEKIFIQIKNLKSD